MTTYTVPKRVHILKDKFSKSIGLPFKELLPETLIRELHEKKCPMASKRNSRKIKNLIEMLQLCFEMLRCAYAALSMTP